MNKKVLFGILILVAIGASIYLYMYKGHRDISTEKVAYVVSIGELQKEFAANDSVALTKYQDKTIQLTAEITSVDIANKAIVLDDKVFATFNDSLSRDVVSGKIVKIKGRFLGYDELLNEYKIDQCSIINQNH